MVVYKYFRQVIKKYVSFFCNSFYDVQFLDKVDEMLFQLHVKQESRAKFIFARQFLM
jgi:hypothetical protein